MKLTQDGILLMHQVDIKLDKIIENVTQIRVDAANQRVLDSENKNK